MFRARIYDSFDAKGKYNSVSTPGGGAGSKGVHPKADGDSPMLDGMAARQTTHVRQQATGNTDARRAPAFLAYCLLPLASCLFPLAFCLFPEAPEKVVANGNGTSIWYTYDAARRVTRIEHRDLLGQVFHRLEYTYDGRYLPLTLTESDQVGWTATVAFTYETRGRLLQEVRTGQNPYELAYEYDLGGNRTRKVDALNQTEVVYHYDLEDPLLYGSNNNRLEYYETFDTSGPDPVLVSTTWYYYNASGNVKQIVTNQAGIIDYSSTRLGYAANGQALSYVLGETWTWDGDPLNCPTVYAITYAREFRYDGPRQRYLNRELDPVALMDDQVIALAETWSDYDGDEAHGDFRLNSGVPVELRSFELGIAKADPWTATGGGGTSYYHADLIGTTRRMSNPSGTGVSPVTYTAFGERITGSMSDPGDRYAYAGAWGYQSHEEFPLLHVGARYYDPATGRFLQRDPIGISGGLNVYEYVFSSPTAFVDPTGLIIDTIWDIGNLVYDACTGDWVAFGADAIAVLIPGVPAGATKFLKVGKAVTKTKKVKQVKTVSGKRPPYQEGKPGRKKQGREPREKKRQKPGWKPRKPPKERPPHTPSKKD